MNITDSLLGKAITYKDQYDPTLLFPIQRNIQRISLGVDITNIPFSGADIWNAYEISWLNSKGKPQVAIAEFRIPSDSTFLIESKSFKLYLNSLNNSKFSSMQDVEKLILEDLKKASSSNKVTVKLFNLNYQPLFQQIPGYNIDELDIECTIYDGADHSILACEDEYIEETISSNLLKSNCLVTGQPDWGSVVIDYKGKKLKHDSVLRYLVSFRNHNEFHEHCIERIFMDIYNRINPEYLSVYGRYTRRGGLDICPFRSTDPDYRPDNYRLIRQ